MRAELLKSAQSQAEVCSVFGNPSRVLIVWALGGRELSVGDIALSIECSLQNTSQHLHLMKDKGILVSRREGNTIYYRVKRGGCPAYCCLAQPTFNELPVSNNDIIANDSTEEVLS